MLEDKLEQDIRKHLQDKFHLYMKHYQSRVTVHDRFPYHIDIVYENTKTGAQIHVTNIEYDIYKRAYIIGDIRMIQNDQQEIQDELGTNYDQRAQRIALRA